VKAAAVSIFGMQPEETDPLVFTDRDSAGDDYPPRWLIESMKEKSKKLKDQFPHVVTSVEVVDEWFTITVKVLDKPRIERPDWNHKKLLDQDGGQRLPPNPGFLWHQMGQVLRTEL
jgi:hypothetical protein